MRRFDVALAGLAGHGEDGRVVGQGVCQDAGQEVGREVSLGVGLEDAGGAEESPGGEAHTDGWALNDYPLVGDERLGVRVAGRPVFSPIVQRTCNSTSGLGGEATAGWHFPTTDGERWLLISLNQ